MNGILVFVGIQLLGDILVFYVLSMIYATCRCSLVIQGLCNNTTKAFVSNHWLLICYRFHPSCTGMTIEKAKKLDHFLCSDCSSDDDAKRSMNVFPVSPSLEAKVRSYSGCFNIIKETRINLTVQCGNVFYCNLCASLRKLTWSGFPRWLYSKLGVDKLPLYL